jgi:inosine-uridine nucleoside N-ribohydrolase
MKDVYPSPLLIFDCDPGCDDALAIALVARACRYERVDLLTVAGNVSVDQTTANACRLTTLLAIKGRTNVYRGCSRSLMGDVPSAASVHGRDGLGDAPNNLLESPLRPGKLDHRTNAVERLIALSNGKDTSKRFDMLCTGPLTNLATALNLMNREQRSCFWAQCDRCVVMGGGFGSQGNITHSAEFNAFFDPVAMQMVLDFAKDARPPSRPEERKIHFVPLDSTETVAISLAKQSSKAKPDNVAKFLFYALQQYGEFHAFHCKRPDEAPAFGIKAFDEEAYVRSQLGGSAGGSKLNKFCYLHDPLAAWVLLNWGGACDFWQEAEIRVDTGRGDSRGRIIHCASKLGSAGPVRPIELGTRVKWLDLPMGGAEASTFRREFVTEVAKLLCLPVEETVEPARKRCPLPGPEESR